MGRVVLIVLATAALAGCVGDADSPVADAGDAPASEGDAAEAPLVLPALVDGVEATDCSGAVASAIIPGAVEAPTPEGWAAETTRAWTDIRMYAWQCERLAWGEFERGPVRIVVELHNAHQTPHACQWGTGFLTFWMLHGLWVDDPELADAWARTYGLQAVVADIAMHDEDGPAASRSITWSHVAGGGSVSNTLTVLAEQGEQPVSMPPSRMFWEVPEAVGNGSRLASLDLEGGFAHSPLAERPALAEFDPPLILARYGPAFPMAGARQADGDVGGDFTTYVDLQCTRA